MYKLSAINNTLRQRVSSQAFRSERSLRACLYQVTKAQPHLIRTPQYFFATKKNDKETEPEAEKEESVAKKAKKESKKGSEEKKTKKASAETGEKKKRTSKKAQQKIE